MSNAVSLTVYSSGTTQIYEPELANAQSVAFSTIYPGGRYASLSCFIPRDVTRAWQVKVGYRIVARNGLTVVWEGKITGLAFTVGAGAEQGIQLTAAGMWGQVLEKWTINKPWSEQRISDAVATFTTGTTGAGDSECDLDRNSRLRFTPKGVTWGDGDYAAIRYTAPTGQTWKRLKYSYDLQEAAQAWEISVHRSTDAAAWTQMTAGSGESYTTGTTTVITASATGSIDVTLGTPSRYVELRYYSRAAQAPVEDGTYYGEYSAVDIRTNSGSIEVDTVATDLITFCTDLNTSTVGVSVPGSPLALTPFVTDGQESVASILLRATAFGDTTYAAWGAYVRESDYAPTPNGNPMLFVEAQPLVTGYDYAVRIDEENVQPPLTIVKDADGVYNWIVIRYTDLLDNRNVYLTPDDQSTLTDSTSVSTYGRRATVIDAGQCTSTTALNIGRRYLASNKDAKFYASGPVTVKGYVRGSSGQPIPAANITAGKRLKIENFLTDQVGVTGAGLTFIISKSDYNDDDQTNAMTCGIPDDMSVFLAQLAASQSI